MATDKGQGPSEAGFGEASSAHVTVDEHGIVTGWNAGAEELLGYSSSQITGRAAAVLLAEEIDERKLRSLARLHRWNGRIALRHRDGHRLEIKVLAHHMASDGGRLGEWLVVSAPTGLPSRTDEDADALVLAHFEQAEGLLLALHDTGLRLYRANEAMGRALALSEDDMRGLRPSEIAVHPEMVRLERSMVRALETGEPQAIETYWTVPGESREHAWSTAVTPVKDGAGRVLGVGNASHDITVQYSARRRLMLLANASTRIGSTLDVTRTAQELADVAVAEFADFVSVDLLPSLDGAPEPSGPPAPHSRLALRRVAHQSVLPGTPEAVVAPGEVSDYLEGSPPVESLRSGRALLYQATDSAFADWMAHEPVRAARVRDFGVRSVMTVPLTARGTTLGVVVFLRHRHPEVFREDDLILAEELAARAAVSIDNARRYTRERATAVTLQRSLLPQTLPVQTAVEVASRYLPAGTRAGVGGDWFDVIPLSGARVALVVGDVVGHGIHASATMGRLRTAVLTLADTDLPPDELLTHLDDVVARLSVQVEDRPRSGPGTETETAGDVGATCLYAVYDPVSRHCTIASAGHPVPALVTPHGTAKMLDLPVGPPLGLGGLPFEATDIELPEGSLLALYTDGLVESRERDVDAGVSLLCRVLAQPSASASLDSLCDGVLAALLPGGSCDDVALLLARTKALDTGSVATWEIPADPVAVAQARKEANAQLRAWGLDDADFVTELVVSELVTNAIRYGDPPIHLRLIHDRNLICEVSDASGTAPHMRRARTFDEGGRGLLLVAQLTASWGTRQTSEGKVIWAEQTLSASPSGTFDVGDQHAVGFDGAVTPNEPDEPDEPDEMDD